MTVGPSASLAADNSVVLLALAGYRLGLRFGFFDPAADGSVGQIGDLIVGT